MRIKHVVGAAIGAGVLALGLTACGSSSPSASSGGNNSGGNNSGGSSESTAALTLNQWRSQAGPALAAIATDLEALGQAGGKNDYSAMTTANQNLTHDIKTAQDLPDAPVASVQSLWSQSLDTFSTAASEIQQAIQQQSQSLAQQGLSDLQKGSNQLKQFESALASAAASNS